MSTGYSSPRFAALTEVGERETATSEWAKSGERVVDLFGVNSFNSKVMKDKLNKKVYAKLQDTMKHGKRLDQSIADDVANAVKEWAVEKGATHFSHWFQPMTGITAEKHDAFLSFDEEGQPIERFTGSQLVQAEPDASSFPSGGLRYTHLARGYTIWDPSSPIFILEKPNGKTLYIPSVFVSYDGRTLDQKGPLLRSMNVLSDKAVSMLKLMGNKSAFRVIPSVGCEQEYFVIDEAFFNLRPDLVASGRTVIGAASAKGQQLEDHYFGAIPERIQSFMQEVEYELFRLGVPVKTRHNEVAPAQYETAPIYEDANVAADHNQITMETLRAVAQKYHLTVLLHEKPFAGINGSGKHNNWSFADSDGNNLLDPGRTPHQNLQFLVFLTATLKGVYKRANLLRAAIASAGNDFRLGANEAPPAIISVFIGEQLDRILNAIEAGTPSNESAEERMISLGISRLPDILRDNTDRNRTSPFAFTGNKFEFRAVASSASIATPMSYLNIAVAEALTDMEAAMQAKIAAGSKTEQAILDVVREVVIETKPIRFEGNGYAEEWVTEAEKRGLPNLRKSPEALAEMVKPDSVAFLTASGLFDAEEVHARYHVQLERYIKDSEIEAETLRDLVQTQVLPAAYEHQSMLAGAVEKLAEALNVGPEVEPVKQQAAKLRDFATTLVHLQDVAGKLDGALAEMGELEDVEKEARYIADDVLPTMLEVRSICDSLEAAIADQFWPLPKYREMLLLI